MLRIIILQSGMAWKLNQKRVVEDICFMLKNMFNKHWNSFLWIICCINAAIHRKWIVFIAELVIVIIVWKFLPIEINEEGN